MSNDRCRFAWGAGELCSPRTIAGGHGNPPRVPISFVILAGLGLILAPACGQSDQGHDRADAARANGDAGTTDVPILSGNDAGPEAVRDALRDAGSAGGSGGSAGAGGAGGAAGGASGAAGAGGSGGKGGTGGAGGSAGAGGAGGASSVWRPFSDASPWNTPIPSAPTIDPNSTAMIADWAVSSVYGPHLDVNIGGFSVPLYWADASTPKTLVSCDGAGYGFAVDKNKQNGTAMIPIPAGAQPDPQSDHHLLVIDRSTNLEWGLWNASNSGGTWTCGMGASMDLLGTGVRPPITNAGADWNFAQGPRACGFALIAGLIRPDEILAGRIDHALVVAYPHIRAGFFTPPASTAQATNGQGAQRDRGIPCGGRIQLDPSIDVTTLGLSPAGVVIARALQQYGAYVGDYSGALDLYADNAPDAAAQWSAGLLKEDAVGGAPAKLNLTWFRVLQLGTLYDNGN